MTDLLHRFAVLVGKVWIYGLELRDVSSNDDNDDFIILPRMAVSTQYVIFLTIKRLTDALMSDKWTAGQIIDIEGDSHKMRQSYSENS